MSQGQDNELRMGAGWQLLDELVQEERERSASDEEHDVNEHEDEDEEEEVANGLARSGILPVDHMVAVKKPIHWAEPEPVREPDLADFFEECEVEMVDRIRLCRTYANYLAASMRTPQRKRAKKEEK